MASRTLSAQEILLVRNYMAEAIGVSIGENKAYLIDSRLSPIVADTGARDLLDLIAKAKADPSRRLHDRIVDALTTHETFWFRDERAWAALREAALPSLVTAFRASGRPKFRIWCAACSTGQEPYTLAMLLDTLCSEGRLGGLAPAQIELLATDVAPDTLKAAAAGQYNAIEIQRGLADVWKNKYFAPVPGGDRWVIAESLRRRVSFKRFNLQDDPTSLGRFDFILCRNVAIYFEESVRHQLFRRLQATLQPDGLLMLGGSESLLGLADLYTTENLGGSLFYRRRSALPTAGAKLPAAPGPSAARSLPAASPLPPVPGRR
jgi:chemotaxis protein methyltransferase CheR